MNKINRKKFLKTSAQGAALVSLPFVLRGFPSQALAEPAAGKFGLNEALTHFGVDQSQVQKITAAGLSRRGDYCDLYFQHKIRSIIVLEDKAVNRAYTNVDFGVGFRVLNGDQTGYSFTEDLSMRAMENAARRRAATSI